MDVLILNPHTEYNPKPNEWGIDWWIRPQSTKAQPTNGRISLGYDIELSSDFITKRKTVSPLPILLDPEVEEMVLMGNRNRRKFAQVEQQGGTFSINSGLYLPSTTIMRRIKKHAEIIQQEKSERRRRVLEQLPRENETAFARFFDKELSVEDTVNNSLTAKD